MKTEAEGSTLQYHQQQRRGQRKLRVSILIHYQLRVSILIHYQLSVGKYEETQNLAYHCPILFN